MCVCVIGCLPTPLLHLLLLFRVGVCLRLLFLAVVIVFDVVVKYAHVPPAGLVVGVVSVLNGPMNYCLSVASRQQPQQQQHRRQCVPYRAESEQGRQKKNEETIFVENNKKMNSFSPFSHGKTRRDAIGRNVTCCC